MALMLGVTVVLGCCFHLHDERCRISRKGEYSKNTNYQ